MGENIAKETNTNLVKQVEDGKAAAEKESEQKLKRRKSSRGRKSIKTPMKDANKENEMLGRTMEKKVQETELEKKNEKKSLMAEKSRKRRRSSRGTPLKPQLTQEAKEVGKTDEKIEKVETSKKRRRSSRGTPFKLQKTNTKENETIKKTNNNDANQIEKELEKVVKSRRTSRRSKRQTPVVDENKVHAKKAKTQHLERIPFSDVSEKENTISVSSGQQIIAPVDKNILREAEFYFS